MFITSKIGEPGTDGKDGTDGTNGKMSFFLAENCFWFSIILKGGPGPKGDMVI